MLERAWRAAAAAVERLAGSASAWVTRRFRRAVVERSWPQILAGGDDVLDGDRGMGRQRQATARWQVGRGHTAAVAQPQRKLTATVDIAKELTAIRAVLMGLGAEHEKKIERAIDDASDEAGKSVPDKDELAKALERALGYAKSATNFATEVKNLSWHLSRVIAWLGIKWHTLLTNLG